MKRPTPKALGTLALGTAALVSVPDADAQITFVPVDPAPFAVPLTDGEDSSVTFADIDGDGDFDMIYGDKYGDIRAFENVGTPTSPAFELLRDVDFFDEFLTNTTIEAPALADLDGDGDLEIITADVAGAVRYFENVGTPQKLRPAERTGADNPFDGLTGPFSKLEFADLDGDGDLDLMSIGTVFTINYYENVGSAGAPVFEQRTGDDNPFAEVVRCTGLTLGDGDGDGDLDLVIGLDVLPALDGRLLASYRNVGTPTAPRFVVVPVDRDPLAPFGRFVATPELVDLDADGDLDLAYGSINDLFYLENVTPQRAQGAGATAFEAASVPVPAATRDADGALLAWTHTGPDATYEVHRLLGSAGAFDLLGSVSATDGEAVRFHTGPLGDGASEVRLRRVEADGRSAYGPTAEVRTGLAGTHELGEVYPNPTAAGAQFTLRVAEAQEVALLDVPLHDFLEKVVQRRVRVRDDQG
ncbi:MAG: VCBS repeat-containing protein, partial [Bacteroidota bacterium]